LIYYHIENLLSSIIFKNFKNFLKNMPKKLKICIYKAKQKWYYI